MALPCITHGSEIGLARAIELHLVRPSRIPRAVSFDTLSVPPAYVLVILLGIIRSEAIFLREGII